MTRYEVTIEFSWRQFETKTYEVLAENEEAADQLAHDMFNDEIFNNESAEVRNIDGQTVDIIKLREDQ